MKKSIFNIIIIIVLSILLIGAILISKERSRPNGFTRQFHHPQIRMNKAIDLRSLTFRITGKLDNSLTLKDYNNPTTIFRLDSVSKQIDSTSLHITFKRSSNYINHTHLSHQTYISNSKGEIFKINKVDGKITNFQSNFLFDQATSISDNSLILRSKRYRNHLVQRLLQKINLNNDTINNIKYIFAKPSTEIFSSDGLLHYDKQSSKVIYMFYYTGHFLCLDTNLRVLYKNKTVDTIVSPKIKIGELITKAKDGSLIRSTTQTNLGGVVNQFMTTYGGRVYILSKIKADNESSPESKKGKAIDVYALKDGKYLHSFYLPNFNNLKLNSFFVDKRTISAIYGGFLVIYDYNEI